MYEPAHEILVLILYVTLSGILGLIEVHGRFLDFCIF